MNNAAPPKFGMGARVRRIEDKALVTGAGRFTDDYTPPETLRGVMVRSAMAHARIALSGIADAAAMPGVRLLLTPADLDVLININRNLAAGLRTNPETAAAAGTGTAGAP